jgi:hypothetical protein
MRILAVIAVLALCAGCAGEATERENLAGIDSGELARDAASIMFETYPPARTRLALVQKADDDFGAKLVESLRLHGYAVVEFVEPSGSGDAEAVEKPDGLPFAYLIAPAGAEREIRVTLHVGAESLSRLYEVMGEGVGTRHVPLGFWSQRVDGGESDEPVI